MIPTVHPSTQGFQRATAAYERGRPGYPAEIVDLLTDELGLAPDHTAIDVGAGTGKFTRLIAPLAKVIAVEPLSNMRTHLRSISHLRFIDGTADDLPLPSHCADFIFAAQAFHWFANEHALSEFHRVLKPHGRLVLIWNVRDERAAWNAALTDLLAKYESGTPRYQSQQWKLPLQKSDLFGPLELKVIPHILRGNADTVVDRVQSISFIASMPETEQKPILDEVRKILAPMGESEFEIPYQTHVYWTKSL